MPAEVIAKELEIGKELAINEGKPAAMAEKIAQGRLQRFYKDSTLANQQFVKDNNLTIKAFLDSVQKGAKVVAFRRFSTGK